MKDAVHEFRESIVIGSLRCADCGHVRDHLNHFTRAQADILMSEQMSTSLSFEDISLVKGVALIMLCEKIAEVQTGYTRDEILTMWCRNAVTVLIAEKSIQPPLPQTGKPN